MPALLKQLTGEYLDHRDPERAVPMAAYMRDQFPFLGIPTPARRAIDRRVTAGRPSPSEAELANFANACCARQADNPEFFVRKAIGWALREYSKTDERAVRRFVKQHGRELSALSRTEALKWLSRQGRS